VDDHLGRERKIPFDLSKAIIENAHANHLKVAAHIFYLDDAKALVNAGLDALAHSVRDKPVDRELIAAMKSRGVYQVPTLTRELYVPVRQSRRDAGRCLPRSRAITGDAADIEERDISKAGCGRARHGSRPHLVGLSKKNLKTLHDAGVKIGFGTDTGPPRRIQGYFEQVELELMVDAGLRPAQIIPAATKNAAEFLGAGDLGTPEKGKWADLLVLGKDPLPNIRNVRTIETVWIGGSKVN